MLARKSVKTSGTSGTDPQSGLQNGSLDAAGKSARATAWLEFCDAAVELPGATVEVTKFTQRDYLPRARFRGPNETQALLRLAFAEGDGERVKCPSDREFWPVESVRKSMAEDRAYRWGCIHNHSQGFVPAQTPHRRLKQNRYRISLDIRLPQGFEARGLL
jgi:hypothetical protein